MEALGHQTEKEASSTSAVTEDELFDVLSNRRRRYVLEALKQGNGYGTDIGRLAEQIAAWENDTTVREVTGVERKRVYTALQQSHLPRMDDAGIVRFDKDRGTVEPTPALEDVEVYMDVTRGRDIPWSEFYLGLSAIGFVLLAASWLDAYPFTVLSDVAWGMFVVFSFGVSALIHRMRERKMRLGADGGPPELR